MGFDGRSLQRIANSVRKTEGESFVSGQSSESTVGTFSSRVLIRNNLGKDLNPFSIVSMNGWDADVADFATSEFASNQKFVFKSKIPDGSLIEKIVINQVFIPDKDVGECVLTGLTKVKVNITDVDHKYVQQIAADTDKMTSSADGFEIYAKEKTVTGIQWAIILMDQRRSTSGLFRIYNGPTSAGSYKYYGVYMQKVSGANAFADLDTTPRRLVFLRAAGYLPTAAQLDTFVNGTYAIGCYFGKDTLGNEIWINDTCPGWDELIPIPI